MNDIPITEKLLLNAGGWQAMKPARELLKSGRVSEAKYEPPLLNGYVREGMKNYRSGLRIKSFIDVENICSCWESRSAGKICAHSVAVGLAYLKPPAAVVTAVPNDPTMPEAPAGPQFVAADSAGAALTTLHVILPPNFVGAWQKGQVMIVVEAEVSRNRTLVSALAKKKTFAVDAADVVLIEELRAVPAIFESGMAILSRDAFLRLLPSLQNHPRITFGKATRATISAVALRPELLVESRGEGSISVKCNFLSTGSGKIKRGHEHEHEYEQEEKALLLWNATEAWLLQNNEFVRYGERLPAGSTHLIERPLTLDGDRALRFLAFDLPRLREAFDVRAGEGVRLPEIASAHPLFELRLAGTLSSLTGELMCAYGDRSPIKALSNPQDQFVFRDPQQADRVLMRNVGAENAAVARLEQIGFARTDAGGFVLHGQPNVVRFFATDYPRLQRDWKVILTAQVEKFTDQIERVTPKLEIVGSGQDWFEVRYSLATPGGEVFSNADIQRLLRSGQSQTRLKNGHLAVIDTAGLEDFEQVIRDCDPAQTQPGLYRINRAHAGYVEQTARELGSALTDRREALKKFITGRDAPPGAKIKLGSLVEKLREYQLVGFDWLTRLAGNNLGGILADEMGLGKTVQALAFLRAQQGDGAALVVCPTSLVTNWENEARKFTPELKTLVLEGADRATRFKSIAKVDIVITSYALLRRDIDTLREIKFSTVVLDEAQHIKNPETQNAQAAFALRAKHRFVLTGTPMENSVRDLWSIMNFALPGYLGDRNDFRERYELPIARGSAPDVQRRLARRLQPFLLRRRKRDVAKDLPEKIEQVVPCSLTSHQRAAYDALLREIQQGLVGSGKNVNAGAQRMKMLTGLLRLRQVCCDLRLVGIDKEGSSAKLDLLDELLEEAIDGEHRVLVFSQFVSMLHLIRERLEKLVIPFCYLDGSTKQRQEIVDRFQNDSAIPVFLISLKAGGVGLNLSSADTVIHFDPWWNPAVEAQATDRAHRIGQTRVVTAYKLITRDTVEEKILRLQEKKRAAIDAAIESEEPLMGGLTTEELEELLAYTTLRGESKKQEVHKARFAACAKRAYTETMRAVRKIRYRLEWLGLKFATKFVPVLSRNACYRLALLLGSLGAVLDRRGRRVALSNLQVAFGDEISAERRAQIVRESYQHFARTMLDFFWSPRLTSQNFSRYVEFENRERWDEENTRPGKPVIVGCYHYSNFEWLSIVSAFAGLEGVVIAQQFKNELLDPIFLELRQRSGHRVAPRKGAVMHLYRALRRGERFALLGDLTTSAKLPTVAIKCFGHERCVTFAHVWLHQRTGAPLINVHCEPLPGGRYRVVFHPRIEFPAGASLQEMAQACWDQFEPVVRKNPGPWLWMYKHWRYRPLAANLPAYPFYANISQDFERRLDEGARKLPPMTSKVKLPMVAGK